MPAAVGRLARLMAAAVALFTPVLLDRGPRIVDAAPAAPVLSAPAHGETLPDYGPTLRWVNPVGATQFHLQVTPANDDGPGIDLHPGELSNAFVIPTPPGWFGLLPDMTYTWRVRVSDAKMFVALDHASWGPWAEAKFRTPKVGAITLVPLTPRIGETVTVAGPAIMFSNDRPDIFYFQLELSKDPTFDTDPATATAPVYSTLLHGGASQPRHTYTHPASAPLTDKTTYHWRVRPRVQGDGVQADWSLVYSFKTDFSAAPALTIGPITIGPQPPAEGSCMLENVSTSYAAAADLTTWYSTHSYTGSGEVLRFWYLNDSVTPPIRADLTGSCHAPGFRPYRGSPLLPGVWRLEVWHAGRLLGSTSVTVTPPASLGIGAITVGTATPDVRGCVLTGTATAFPSGVTQLHFRFNWVGTGEYRIRILRDGAVADFIGALTPTGSGCYLGDYGLFKPGSWTIDVTDKDGQPLRRTSFTVG